MSTTTQTQTQPEIETDPFATLQQALAEDRKQGKRGPSALSSNPYGKQLFELNQAWGKRRAEHEALLEPERQAYLAQRDALTAQAKRHQATATPKAPKRSGRPPREDYTDAVKLALAEAYNGRNKSQLRAALGFPSTALLNRALSEGLQLRAKQYEELRKADQA